MQIQVGIKISPISRETYWRPVGHEWIIIGCVHFINYIAWQLCWIASTDPHKFNLLLYNHPAYCRRLCVIRGGIPTLHTSNFYKIICIVKLHRVNK